MAKEAGAAAMVSVTAMDTGLLDAPVADI